MKYPNLKSNEDIYAVAADVGIPPHRISYTNQASKWMVLENSGIDIHVDDDKRELYGINFTNVKAFDVNAENFKENFMLYIKALIDF